MTLYKAVDKKDGRDFYSHSIDYVSKIGESTPVNHPQPVRDSEDARYYISVSVKAGDCTGFRWPATLLEVTSVGKTWTPHPGGMPNKRAAVGVRVVRELPAHLLFGPQGEVLVGMIEAFDKMTPAKHRALYGTRPAGWYTMYLAVAVGGRAARAGLRAARSALSGRLVGGWDGDDGRTAYGAALAVLLRHTRGKKGGITQAEYDTLTAPWVQVTGQKAHPEDVVF
jgi:hypothetical protein